MRETNTHRVRHPLIIAQENFTLSFDGAPFLTPPLSGVSFQPFTHVCWPVGEGSPQSVSDRPHHYHRIYFSFSLILIGLVMILLLFASPGADDDP